MDRAEQAASLAQETLDYNIQRAIRNSKRPQASIKPMGYCHTCDTEVEGEKLFCNGRCASKFPG